MWMLCVALAWAEIPPPNYREALMGSAAEEVTRLARTEGIPAAETFARRWERSVGGDARISYELGLA